MNNANYVDLYSSAMVNPTKMLQIQSVAKVIMANQVQYSIVQKRSGVPWWCVAAIHSLEGALNFTRHLHNGDPLTARTVHVPAGRPVLGQPPFAWVDSAVDALSSRKQPDAWGVDGCLRFLEEYNGLGYQKHGINTPYLWNMTNQYSRGLYIADGSFAPIAVPATIGAAAILKVLELNGSVQLQ